MGLEGVGIAVADAGPLIHYLCQQIGGSVLLIDDLAVQDQAMSSLFVPRMLAELAIEQLRDRV